MFKTGKWAGWPFSGGWRGQVDAGPYFILHSAAAIPVLLISFYGFTLSATYSLGKLLAVAGCGLWLALGNSYRRPADVWLLAYLAAVSVLCCFSADPWVSIWHLYGTYQAGLIAALVLIPYWACVGAGDREWLAMGLRAGSAVMAWVCLAQRFLPLTAPIAFLLPQPLPAGARAYSTMGSPIYVGAVAVLCLPYLRRRWEYVLAIAGLWATGSRGAWIAALAGFGYLQWPKMDSGGKKDVLYTIAGVLGCAMIWRPPSDLGRIAVWHAAVLAFKARPWTGWGPGNYLQVAELYRNPIWDEVYGVTTQDHAHNLFLEAAATMGVPGILTLCVLLTVLWRSARGGTDRRARAALLGVGLVGMLNPLPLVAKALALMIAASSSAGTPRGPRSSRLIGFFACNIFLATMLLTHWDRLMTYYGDCPWSFSSAKAAYFSGVIKLIPDRRAFKL